MPDRERTFLGHPVGLSLLFVVEMWERFSYYGMRALLVLYLARSSAGENPGRGWSKEASDYLFGWYTGMAYLLPIIGGLIADRLIGTHRSLVIGALVIALGHIVLAVSGIGALAGSAFGMSVFIAGLVLIVLGTTPTARAAMFWLLATYFFHTVGELCMSPTGLAFLTRVAPLRSVSLLMGIWFLANAVANKVGGQFAGKIEAIESGAITLPWYAWFRLGGQADFFLFFVLVSAIAGTVVLAIAPLLKRLVATRL